MTKNAPSKLILEISGGMLRTAYCSDDIELLLYNWDNIEQEMPHDIDSMKKMFLKDIKDLNNIY
jgi:hypothetical protein